MPLEAPSFWYREGSVLGTALAPLGRLYGRIAEARAVQERLRQALVQWMQTLAKMIRKEEAGDEQDHR